MRLSVEPWAPEYGTPVASELAETTIVPDVDIEVPAADWVPLEPDTEPARSVLFVDGVRRVDAHVWVGEEDGVPVSGLCATYAAGAVRCDTEAKLVGAEVRRGLFTSAPGAEAVTTKHGVYGVRATAGSSLEELWLGLQQRMGELEREVASHLLAAELIITDGPLTGRQHVPGGVGYVKTHRVQYLPAALQTVLTRLLPGQRTPLFLTTTSWSRYSWYTRLPGGGDAPLGGIVRCEVSADRDIVSARRLADRVSVTLPRFASAAHKDPRAPQNLYPIGGLERELRRRLGDQQLLYRALRVAAHR
ncbi:MAG: hypothetical protein GXP34_05140 [Actinobacteria bacterium]|nr:hypothetical protein [Actinomycetota bacterium]